MATKSSPALDLHFGVDPSNVDASPGKRPGVTKHRIGNSMDVKTVDSLPPVIRGAGTEDGKQREQIGAWLQDGRAHLISGVEDRKAHNRLQQKIRNIAKNKGINVTVRYYAETQETGFQGLAEFVETSAKSRKSPQLSE